MRVLIDTNILVDLMLEREPFYNDALNLCITAINQEIDAFLAASTITDLHYIMRHDLSEEKTRESLFKILGIFPLLDTTADDIRRALASPMEDFEDAVLVETARRGKMEAIITRNEKDFKESPIPVYPPGEFLTRFFS